MKLKLFEIDFEKNLISFEVPCEIMEKARWRAGFAIVNVSEISDVEDAETSFHCPCCNMSWDLKKNNTCQCGATIRTAEK